VRPLNKGKHKEDCMKKLVVLAILGVALAAIPVTVALSQQSMPCYKGQTVGPCPK